MNPVSVASSIIHIVSIASQVASSIPLFYGQIKNATPETNNLSRNLRKLESILEEINKATRYGGNAASLMSFRHFEIKLAELQAGTIKELDGCIQVRKKYIYMPRVKLTKECREQFSGYRI